MIKWRDGVDLQLVTFQWLEYIVTVPLGREDSIFCMSLYFWVLVD